MRATVLGVYHLLGSFRDPHKTSITPPVSFTAASRRVKDASMVSAAFIAASRNARVANHVTVCIVHNDQIKRIARNRIHKLVP